MKLMNNGDWEEKNKIWSEWFTFVPLEQPFQGLEVWKRKQKRVWEEKEQREGSMKGKPLLVFSLFLVVKWESGESFIERKKIIKKYREKEKSRE